MKFDLYFPFHNKEGKKCPGIQPERMSWADIKKVCTSQEQISRIQRLRATTEKKDYEEQKKAIPAVCFVGDCSKTRALKYMTPTGLYMIDVDHCKEPRKAWETIAGEMGAEYLESHCLFAHVTVGGEGLRFAMRAMPEYDSLIDNMNWFNKSFKLERFGKYDSPCKDYSRISFLPTGDDFLYENPALFEDDANWNDGHLVNDWQDSDKKRGNENGLLFSDAETIDNFTDEEIKEFSTYEYRGNLISTIVEKWVETKGAPGKGEVHNYYNDMIKNFRNIVSNNKRALLYLLPRFGHDASECWSSIKSICKVSSLSSLPRPFYYFLKDNGFYNKEVTPQGSLAEYMLADEEETPPEKLPWLPPVFREWVRITPKDFRPSVVNALMPVLGTLTSYLQAPYYYDGRMHTTSFFSIIYAPAGTGKGFVERINDIMFQQLKIRDYIQQARENIFLATIARKGANEKSPEDPHTTLRLIPPKNSEAEFLQKMKDNQGYHMFTYAAEMDSWAKGVKAAGGNKDDMIRIAWDNGEYGQQFKSANTFKGTVQLYWNLLITGTVQQLMQYFKNVENGLITRCSFTTIENQEFADAPVWKAMNEKEKKVIKSFMERCDANTYEEPCNLLPEDVDCVAADKFDEEITWRFTYRKRQTVDMEWLRPTIEEFLETQRQKASADIDKARDVFRRRVAVRGFRLGLLCTALWDKPRESDLKKCIPFIEWWMEQDIEGSLKLWGTRYNNEVEDNIALPRRVLFNELPKVFSKMDVYNKCGKLGIKTPVRNIIYLWQKNGYIKKTGMQEYEKVLQK